MFSKQALKSFQSQLEMAKLNGIPETQELQNINSLISHIQISQCYHMGDTNILKIVERTHQKICKKEGSNTLYPFVGQLGTHIKLPFDECWFDFINPTFLGDMFGLTQLNTTPLKMGLAVSRVNKKAPKDYPEIIQVMVCYSYGPTNTWNLCGEAFFIKINDNFTEDEARSLYTQKVVHFSNSIEYNTIIETSIKRAMSGNVIRIPTVPYDIIKEGKNKSFQAGIEIFEIIGKHVASHSVTILNHFLKILNCHNVITETISTYIPKKKKKGDNNKNKGTVYKVLKFKLPKSRTLTSKKSSTPTEENIIPLHVCEGHYKTYTEERPLFGKIVGSWWWSDFVRGDRKNGEIIKDYHATY